MNDHQTHFHPEPLSSEESLRLYLLMYQARKAEEAIMAHYHTDQMKTPMHMSMGQEAGVAGVIAALQGRGDVFSTYRSHATFLCQTEDLDPFFAEMYGKKTGTAEGRSGSMHLAFPEKGHHLSSAIVSSCLPVAVGASYANKLLQNDRMSVVFFGDGAMDEGVFWESMNAACVFKVPMLFVCEDNGLAVHTGKSQRHGYKSIDDIVKAFDCLSYTDETNNVESIYQRTKQAVKESYALMKPAFLRIQCHRYLEHVGINEDWEAGYRSRPFYSWWYENDSLKMQRQKLTTVGFEENFLQSQEQHIQDRIEKAIQKAEKADFCSVERLYAGVFYEKN